MTNKIIDSPYTLLGLNRDDLDNILLDDKYNKANLRQLIRETLKMANEYKTAFEYELWLNKNKEDAQ